MSPSNMSPFSIPNHLHSPSQPPGGRVTPPEPQWGEYAPQHLSVLHMGLLHAPGALDLNDSDQWKANAVDLTGQVVIRHQQISSSGGGCDEVCVSLSHIDIRPWSQVVEVPPIHRLLQTWGDVDTGGLVYARYRGPTHRDTNQGASLWTLTMLDSGEGTVRRSNDDLNGVHTFELEVKRKVVFSPAQTVPEWRVNGYRLFGLEELQGPWRYGLKTQPTYHIKPAHVVIPVPPDEG